MNKNFHFFLRGQPAVLSHEKVLTMLILLAQKRFKAFFHNIVEGNSFGNQPLDTCYLSGSDERYNFLMDTIVSVDAFKKTILRQYTPRTTEEVNKKNQ